MSSLKRGLGCFLLFFIFGFAISKIVGEKRILSHTEITKKIIKSRTPVKFGERGRHMVLPFEVDMEDKVVATAPEENEARDSLEWQGMRVPKMQPPCDGKESCGMALACLDGTCGPCKEDGQCGVGERCVLQHCVQSEKIGCNKRDDCDEEDALCVLSGYSPGIRGNGDMVAFCQSSSELEEQIEDPEERRIFDQIRGPYEASGLEFSDLSKGLQYE